MGDFTAKLWPFNRENDDRPLFFRDESHNFQTNLYKSLQISPVASIRDIVIDCLLKNTKDRLDSKIGHCKSNLMVRRA